MNRIKKIVIACLVIGSLQAAPVGNTAAPEVIEKGFLFPCDSSFDLRFGYEGDFVSDGRLEQFNQSSGRVDNYRQHTNSGTATLNVLDRLDIYGVFGVSNTHADWRFENASTEVISRIDLQTQNDFLWAFGSRVILFEWCNIFLGTGGRYSVCDSTPQSLSSDGVDSSVEGATVRWRQWQINLDLSYKIRFFTPYVGTKYSCERTYLNQFSVPIAADGTGDNTFKTRDAIGFYLGCTLSNGHYFMLNIEGRLVDEEAVTVSADFRF